MPNRPQRPSWKGFVRLNLVSIPVLAYNARVGGGGKIDLDWLHRDCHSRIQYKKVCPIHGEVSKDEIVSAYQYAKDQYVEIENEELGKLRTESDRAITIDTFVAPDAIDPIHFERTYYLLPDGNVAQKPYVALMHAMAEQSRHAVAQVVLFGRETLVLLHPQRGVLAMTALSYADEVKDPADFTDSVGSPKLSAKELDLTKMLVDASTAERFDLDSYHDTYIERVKQLIEAKVEGKEIVAAPTEEEPQVINLMDALRKSVAQAKRATGAKPKRKSPAARRPAAAHKRRAS
jgi:DNA end-binding protein Ku